MLRNEQVKKKGETKMSAQLSEKRAGMHIAIIGIFYLLSGMWEFLLGETEGMYLDLDRYFLLGVYRNYAMVLGLSTIIVGILLLCRRNVARLMALSIAWWNLFTSPILLIWGHIYKVKWIEESVNPILSADLVMYSVVLISIYTFLRIYIIRMLKVSKAGYIFLRK